MFFESMFSSARLSVISGCAAGARLRIGCPVLKAIYRAVTKGNGILSAKQIVNQGRARMVLADSTARHIPRVRAGLLLGTVTTLW